MVNSPWNEYEEQEQELLHVQFNYSVRRISSSLLLLRAMLWPMSMSKSLELLVGESSSCAGLVGAGRDDRAARAPAARRLALVRSSARAAREVGAQDADARRRPAAATQAPSALTLRPDARRRARAPAPAPEPAPARRRTRTRPQLHISDAAAAASSACGLAVLVVPPTSPPPPSRAARSRGGNGGHRRPERERHRSWSRRPARLVDERANVVGRTQFDRCAARLRRRSTSSGQKHIADCSSEHELLKLSLTHVLLSLSLSLSVHWLLEFEKNRIYLTVLYSLSYFIPRSSSQRIHTQST